KGCAVGKKLDGSLSPGGYSPTSHCCCLLFFGHSLVVQTSASLLERLRLQSDAGAWQRLIDLYEPLIRGWLRRHDLQPADSGDLVQGVLGVLVKEIPGFEHT